jgi:hypothetical protein
MSPLSRFVRQLLHAPFLVVWWVVSVAVFEPLLGLLRTCRTLLRRVLPWVALVGGLYYLDSSGVLRPMLQRVVQLIFTNGGTELLAIVLVLFGMRVMWRGVRPTKRR